jgi:hypothetical protein
MADVYAVFGTLLALGIAFPGMLAAYWLLFPTQVETAGQRLTKKPGKTFLVGLAAAIAVAIPITLLFVIGMPFTNFLGALCLVIILAIAAIGAAGIVLKMAGRLEDIIGAEKPMRNFIGGAVALELAVIFPIIGWFLIIPVTLITSLGAAVWSLLGKKKLVTSEASLSSPIEV